MRALEIPDASLAGIVCFYTIIHLKRKDVPHALSEMLRVLKPGGILVSVVAPVPEAAQTRHGVRAAYFYVDVTTARLNTITHLFDSARLVTDVGTVLGLADARIAHEMLGGAPHKRGKIVLSIAA